MDTVFEHAIATFVRDKTDANARALGTLFARIPEGPALRNAWRRGRAAGIWFWSVPEEDYGKTWYFDEGCAGELLLTAVAYPASSWNQQPGGLLGRQRAKEITASPGLESE